MTTPTAIEVDCSTGVVTERPLTAAEISQRAADQAAFEVEKAKQQEEAEALEAAKASANAKLAALGLTTEEIQALTK